MEIDKSTYDEIATLIQSDDSPLGIDAWPPPGPG